MLGLGDAQIAAAMIACVAVTLFGVVYGIVRWNSDNDELPAKKARRHRSRRRRKHRR